MTQQKWWQTPRIQKWAWDAWRYYSWRPTYRLTLTPSEPSAYVDMVNHVVVCNPEYPYPPLHLARHVRGLPADLHEFQQTYLESLIAHEAGHTHHSGLLPAGLHGQLVNMLEDERMERLTAVDFPHLTALFQLAADVDAAHAIEQGGLGGDVLRGCLLHRFTCHHPIWSFTPDQADAGLWPEVKAIVEEAWVAPTYDAVVDAARRILQILNLPEQAPEREEFRFFLDGGGQALLPQTPGPSLQGSAAGDGPGQLHGAEPRPIKPEVDPQVTPRAEHLQAQVQGEARRLAAALCPPALPDRTQPSRDRGRYRYDRHETGSERPFDLKVGVKRPGPAHLRLAIDVSSSMNYQDRLAHARRMAFILTLAAQQSGTPILATAFADDAQPLIQTSTLPTAALNAVADLQAYGNTRLAPALQGLWSPVLPGRSITVILSDGALMERDYTQCAQLRARHDGLVVPILLDVQPDVAAAYERAFGPCVLMSDPAQLTTHVLTFLRTLLR
ncbi:VWA domain-containing protein [Deinococcus soli (ex Cha et al. 2016)]|uniref:VWA domain-containing protein n=1 Tax=Deinococcus soli (ex Cha et al. 2016) TaxID=1309411 RepID=UPI0019997F14|nr:vWA domain-containing protein [Deinococcus soli (ex Cha et al. 2016)]GGB61015.1 hypothetical protein GCM10008019_16200 [Deinococcus soli (ex Cha et al. 2016)]